MFKSLVVSFLLTAYVGSGLNTVDLHSVDNYVPQSNTIQVYQFVENGDFSNGLNGWNVYSGTPELTDNVLTVNNATGRSGVTIVNPISFTAGDKCYTSFYIKCDGVNDIETLLAVSDNNEREYIVLGNSSDFVLFNTIITFSDNFSFLFDIFPSVQSQVSTFSVSNFQIFNLTSIFGSGNEPSKAVFKQMLGNQYYDYGSHKIELDWHTGDRVYGLYNLKDYMDFTISDFPYFEPSDPIETIVFEDTTDGYFRINPMQWDNQTVYLSSMRLQATFVSGYFGIGIELNYYNYVVSGFTSSYFIPSGARLNEIPSQYIDTWGKLILQVNQFKDMSVRANQYFNALFTHEDNYYVTSYSGYYNLSSSSINTSVNVFGSFTFNNSLYFGLTNNVNGLEPTYIRCAHWGLPDDWVYDGVINGYYYDGYDLPLTNTQVVNFNFQFSYVKLTYDTYTSLSNVGTWQFVRDTSYDNVDFYDLMFAIGDTPIYFISRLLSFELFGMNLFVALTGLLTVCAILFLIRKFF